MSKITNKNEGVRVAWAMLCQNASVDQHTNAVSLFNILEQVTLSDSSLTPDQVRAGGETKDFEKKTQVNTKYVLVAQVQRDADFQANKVQLNLKVTDPIGEELLNNDFPLVFSAADPSKTRAIINFEGMLVTKTGRYVYTVSVKLPGSEKPVSEHSTSVDVVIRK